MFEEPRADRQRADNWDAIKRLAQHWLKEATALAREFDESKHPRDEAGKFTSGDGASSSAGEAASSASRPTIKLGAGASQQAFDKVNSALAAIPATHAEALKNVPMVLFNTSNELAPGELATVYGRFSFTDDKPVRLAIAENEASLADDGGIELNPHTNIEHTMTHELGHAFDHHNGWKLGRDINRDIRNAADYMEVKEREDARYFLNEPREAFAELYALAYVPTRAEGDTYFGMTRDRAEEIFKDALTKVRAL